ncbi:hypothetical protein MMC10_006010 [Thelotrema lepadinum]|nr:hypothetical protein [Thelotrema lepadinum]
MSSIGTDKSSLAIGFCFPVLGAVFVGLRFYTRWHLKQPREIDDWLCIPAWLCVTGCCVSLLAKAFNDLATPESDLDSAAEQQFVAQITGALTVFYNFASAFIKLSILFFYRRIFVGQVFNVCNWILVGLSIVWVVYATLCWLLYCGTDLQANFEGPWDNCPPWGFEIQIGVYVLDTVIDFCLLILPIPLVLRLHLGLHKKLGIVVVFILGGFAFIAGLCNTIIQFVNWVEPIFVEDADGTFFQGISSAIYNWPSIEVGVGLIACNLPSLSHHAAFSVPKQAKRLWDLGRNRTQTTKPSQSLARSSSKEDDIVLVPQRGEFGDSRSYYSKAEEGGKTSGLGAHSVSLHSEDIRSSEQKD